MGFHEYRTCIAVCKKNGISDTDIFHLTNEIVKKEGDDGSLHQISCELLWKAAGRPYYNIYPSMADAMSLKDIASIKMSQLVLPIDVCLIRLPLSSVGLRSFLYAKGKGDGYVTGTVSLDAGEFMFSEDIGGGFPSHNMWHCCHDDTTVEEFTQISDSRGEKPLLANGNERQLFEQSVRLLAMIALIGNNPDLIQPIPLNKDAERYSKTLDPALIEKAKRKGLHGYDVGKNIVCAPGFRRPHFGIRWTEKGRTVPRLVPIKGSVVMRNKMAEIPTGYLDDEENDKLTPAN